jgi:RNA polymerase sporulation-specific sigma factor
VNEDRLVRVAQTGDEAARAELLEAAAPFIRSMARHYRTSGTGQRELVRAGEVGLRRALESYETERGTSLGPYAS